MADQVIAQQHGGLVAAEVVDRRALAAKLGFVEHVVVHERGHVDHLDDGGERDVRVGQLASPHALPASSTSIGRSILPRKRLTCLTSVLTQGMSLSKFRVEQSIDGRELRRDASVRRVERGRHVASCAR